MNARNQIFSNKIQRQNAVRGQSLVIAVIVMFVMLFVGGVFVGIVARNLLNTSRDTDTQAALELAQAGIRLCDQNLMYSPEGADWRPAPENPATLSPNDPDAVWLRNGDWTRVNFAKGRALIRVTYQPDYTEDPTDPAPIGKRRILNALSKKLKIESIGRVGFVNRDDPTTFLNSPPPRLRRELVAYKDLGLTDNLMFVTNRFNDSKFTANIGVPPIGVRTPAGYSGPQYPLGMQIGNMPVRTFGPPPTSNYHIPGAPIRVNGNLNIMGPLNIAINPLSGEGMFVAGIINTTANDATNPARFLNVGTGATGPILSSGDPNFTTFGGILRDDSSSPDAQGYPRNASRLEPPVIDTPDPATGVTRYRALTRDAGRIIQNINTGAVGMGGGVYIDNFNNTEPETRVTPGGRSLRSVWLDPKSPNSRWNGAYYIPQGVFIEAGYPVVQDRDKSTSELLPNQFVPTPGFRIVRDPDDRHFQDPAGRFASTTEVDFTFFIYKPAGLRPVLKMESEFHRSALRQAPFNMTEKQIDKFLPEFNGTVFAEGNVRIRGLMPAKQNIPIRRESTSDTTLTDAQIYELTNAPSVTIASGANIYVEGSLIRESAESMIALLAQENVVVNPTLFVSPNKGLRTDSTSGDLVEPFHVDIDLAEVNRTPPLTLDFLFGDNPQLYVDTTGSPMSVNLLMRHGVAQPGNTFLNLFVNDWYQRTSNDPRYKFNVLPAPSQHVFPMGTDANTGASSYFELRSFALYPKPTGGTYLFTGDAGYTWPQGLKNTIRPSVDVSFAGSSPTLDYLFGRAAIVPMDVRIESVMYAQNGSFFVIPGYPYNNDPKDTPGAAEQRAAAAGLAAGSQVRPLGTEDLMPYYGEPIDCRITIVGSISQNRTASVGDQAAWMQQWGYIPEVYGSTGKNPVASPTERMIPRQHLHVDELGLSSGDQRNSFEQAARISRGLRLIYDPNLATPYVGYSPANRSFRTDDAYFVNSWPQPTKDVGRVLPPLPRLPVCPGFVYYGEVR